MRVGLGVGARRRGACADQLGQGERQLAQALVAWPRETSKTGSPRASRSGADHLGELARLGDVDLVERDQPRAGRRSAAVRPRSSASITSRSVTGSRPGLQRRAVEDVHERRAALDVAQELQAQPLALAGARDQARARRRR